MTEDEHAGGTRLKPGTGTRLAPQRGGEAPEAPGGTRLRPSNRTGSQDSDGPSAARGATDREVSSNAKALEPGLLIKDRFLLLEQIGQGGMGSVWKARDQEYEGHEQHVALKFLSGELKGRPEALRALEEEVRKTHELAHPNIVTVYDFYRDAPHHFISMEFLEGEPLDQLLRGRTARGMPFTQAWPIIESAGTALAYAHRQGIIHSDFKPGNVFVTRNDRVKVLDFGIARAARMDADDFDVSVLGGLTPAYASPEMVLSLEPDPRDDVYALACVACELLSGRHPFDRMPAHRAQHAGMAVPTIDGVSRARMRALKRGLAFTRDARTPSVHEFLAELEGAVARHRLLRLGTGIAIGTVAVLGASGYVYSQLQRCANIDAAFLRALQAESAARPLDAEFRDDLLEQGQYELAQVEEIFDASRLSGGVSSAYGAFTNVLRMDPNDEAALAGILRIFALYEAEAERLLDAGAPEQSIEIASYGLELHPQHCGLNDIRERASAALE